MLLNISHYKFSCLKIFNILLLFSQIISFVISDPHAVRQVGSGIIWKFIQLHVWCLGRANLKSLELKELELFGHLSVSKWCFHMSSLACLCQGNQIFLIKSQASKTSVLTQRMSSPDCIVLYDVALEIKQCQFCYIIGSYKSPSIIKRRRSRLYIMIVNKKEDLMGANIVPWLFWKI